MGRKLENNMTIILIIALVLGLAVVGIIGAIFLIIIRFVLIFALIGGVIVFAILNSLGVVVTDPNNNEVRYTCYDNNLKTARFCTTEEQQNKERINAEMKLEADIKRREEIRRNAEENEKTKEFLEKAKSLLQ
jgi:flagellar basal body-associated protein FliL